MVGGLMLGSLVLLLRLLAEVHGCRPRDGVLERANDARRGLWRDLRHQDTADLRV